METRVSSSPHVLVVDCDGIERQRLSHALRKGGYSASGALCGPPAFRALESDVFDVVVLYSCADGIDGLKLLSGAHARHSGAEFVVIANDLSADTAVHAMKLGATDYLTRPAAEGEIVAAVARAMDRASTQREVARLRRRIAQHTRGGIVGRSKAIEQVFDLVERAAPTAVSVLVSGETGTGKELIARAVHDLSPRRELGFVPVSCASVPENLMESSLFGHVRGAFTGAFGSRPGLFEEAKGGTVFLDEIECLRLDLQPKLLRVLQERMIQRVGGRHDVPVDFRLVAATNGDLATAAEKGLFRDDLFYRLNVFPVHLPPLRERPDDIPLLATHFRDAFAAENYVEPLPIPDCCMDWMMAYDWPGNVRELKHTMERALLLSDGEAQIKCSSMAHLTGKRAAPSWGRALAEDWTLSRLEQEYAEVVLHKTGGNKGRAAEILGIDRRTLYRKLRDWRPLNPPEESGSVPDM
ncbi:MAG TPA: sigma-54 dependent transcriptional regulator [Longimicrobiales bacterium]|nr:sigma-54 dependent transcriptional regulator [Longimicrobiales bacterium]